MTDRTCSIAGCEKPVSGYDWCNTHRSRWKRTGTTEPSDYSRSRLAPTADRGCLVEGCEKPHRCRGWCNTHWLRWKRHGSTADPTPPVPRGCSVDGCDTTVRARGMCTVHYDRWMRNGTTELLPRPEHIPSPCAVQGCVRPSASRGWCRVHYRRWSVYGDTSTVKPMPSGAAHYLWAGEDVSYRAAHARTQTHRGLASVYDCTVCGEQAKQWAYDHEDPDEKQSDQGSFSTDPDHYRAMCVSCHLRFDRNRSANDQLRFIG